MSGKGSKPRPFSIPKEEYDKRWEEIFKKNEKDPAGVLLGEDSAFQADEVGSNPIARSNNN